MTEVPGTQKQIRGPALDLQAGTTGVSGPGMDGKSVNEQGAAGRGLGRRGPGSASQKHEHLSGACIEEGELMCRAFWAVNIGQKLVWWEPWGGVWGSQPV